MEYYLDENTSLASVRAIRAVGLAAASSHELAMNGSTDVEQLRFAARHGWVLVTRDQGDFKDAIDELDSAGEEFPGVLFIPRSFVDSDPGSLARGLAEIEQLDPAGLPTGFIGYVHKPRLSR